MRVERQRRVVFVDHRPVTEVDAVELADGDPARSPHGILEPGHLHLLTCMGGEA
jgi:hypothetical protein